MYVSEERGALHTPDYRLYICDESGPVSAWHDVPLWADRARGLLHMVVEVPRWSNAKLELSTGEPLAPLKQDSKKGQPRFVANVFPHRGYPWNYGALPQTWESPRHVHADTGARGDNDPLDVLELGWRVRQRGEVVRVRVLGALALLDEGETDWKLLAIADDDPDFERLRSPADLEAVRPGLLAATVEWFRLYKVPDGKPPNAFAFDAQPKDAEYAMRVVEETHAAWRELVAAPPAGLSGGAVLAAGAAERLSRAQAADLLQRQRPRSDPVPPPPEVDKWHFVANL